MQANIELDGSSIECEFEHPFKATPILTAGPVGTKIWQPGLQHESNAKIKLKELVELPSRCTVVCEEQRYQVTINRQQGWDAWGTIIRPN
jgi:hypothetical protein